MRRITPASMGSCGNLTSLPKVIMDPVVWVSTILRKTRSDWAFSICSRVCANFVGEVFMDGGEGRGSVPVICGWIRQSRLLVSVVRWDVVFLSLLSVWIWMRVILSTVREKPLNCLALYDTRL